MEDDILYQFEIVKGTLAIDGENVSEHVPVSASDLLYQFEKDNGVVSGVNNENIQALITDIRLYGFNEITRKRKLIKHLSIDEKEQTFCFGVDDKFHNVRLEIDLEINIDDEKILGWYEKTTNFNY